MKYLILAIIVLILIGCGQDHGYAQQDSKRYAVGATDQPGRFEVQSVQIIHDSLAYDGERAVYLMKDHQTGKEYIGLSGVGISEIGSHACGKGCTTEDER
jgi:hypothetical protein